jgi:mycofactocin system glycosyltransferase
MAAGLATTRASIGEVGEVVVVDDGSVDADAVHAAAGDAVVLRNDRSRGPAAARDLGWRAATSPIVAFVDAEVHGPTGVDWLAPLLAQFDDPTLGAVAPRVHPTAGSSPRALAAYERVRSSLDLGPRPAPVRPGSPVPYVPTAALLVRRDALAAIDGFDTALHVGEDVDLVWRLHASGWRVRYDPSVVVTHPSRATIAGWLRQKVVYGTSAAALARRHGDDVAAARITGWTAATWIAVGTGHPVLGAGIAAGSGATLVRELETFGLSRPDAARVVAGAMWWGARQVAEAIRRPWWPFAMVLGLASRRTRPALLAAVVIPPVLDALERRTELGVVPFAALRLADDVAYGTGVWLGCVRERSLRALLPAFVGRRRTSPAPVTSQSIRGTCRRA